MPEDNAQKFNELKKQLADQQTNLTTIRFLLECVTVSQFAQLGDAIRRAKQAEEDLLKQVATFTDPSMPPATREYLVKTISE